MPDPLSDEQLAEIKRRALPSAPEYRMYAVIDRAHLIREVDRLRAENAKWREVGAQADQGLKEAAAELDARNNEITRMGQEIVRANGVAEDTVPYCPRCRTEAPCETRRTLDPETPAAPAESHAERPAAGTGSTGVPEPHGRSEADHWLKFDRDRQITGCQCGFAADTDSDCGWGDSVVAHLLEVGAENAVPDVDGWTLSAHPAGFMLSHETEEDRVLTAYTLPLGAVLAFIADTTTEEGTADA